MRYECARGAVPPPWVSVSAVTYCNMNPESYSTESSLPVGMVPHEFLEMIGFQCVIK